MSERNTVLRSLHDVGLAAWFGGSLMGAVGLNGAARAEGGMGESATRIAACGWSKWEPVNAAAIGARLVGSSGLLAANSLQEARFDAGSGAASLGECHPLHRTAADARTQAHRRSATT